MKTSKKAPLGGTSRTNDAPGKKTKIKEDPKETNRLISDDDDEDDFEIPLDDDIKGFNVFDDDEDDDDY